MLTGNLSVHLRATLRETIVRQLVQYICTWSVLSPTTLIKFQEFTPLTIMCDRKGMHRAGAGDVKHALVDIRFVIVCRNERNNYFIKLETFAEVGGGDYHASDVSRAFGC